MKDAMREILNDRRQYRAHIFAWLVLSFILFAEWIIKKIRGKRLTNVD